jgi:hypothetical protein
MGADAGGRVTFFSRDGCTAQASGNDADRPKPADRDDWLETPRLGPPGLSPGRGRRMTGEMQLAANWAAHAIPVEGPSPYFIRTRGPAPSVAPVTLRDIVPGPGTARFYTREDLALIGWLAHGGLSGGPLSRVPVAVLSIDDANFLNNPNALQRIMPPGMPRLPDELASELRNAVIAGTTLGALAVDAGGMTIKMDRRPENTAAGYILLVPGSRRFTEDYFRALSRVNFPPNKISPQLWRKIVLWAATHEAMHAGLNAAGISSSEYGADTGTLKLLQDPAVFGEQRQEIARLVLGLRGLNVLFHEGVGTPHDLSGALRPSDDNPEADRLAELQAAVQGGMSKIAVRMVANGDLHPTSKDADNAALERLNSVKSDLSFNDIMAFHAFRREREEAQQIPICVSGEAGCQGRGKVRVIASDHPFVTKALTAVRQLSDDHAFKGAEEALAGNILWAAQFFGLR